jgi:tight adherence protein C
MTGMLVFLGVFGGICLLGLLVSWFVLGDQRRTVARLKELSDPTQRPIDQPQVKDLALSALPKIGNLLLPKQEDSLRELKNRLVRAGYYGINGPRMFMGSKLLLMALLPGLCASIPYALGLLSLQYLILVVTVAMAAGMFLPDFWLHNQIKKRQIRLRRGLPDALDMLVLCMEGGVSLAAALRRVVGELLEVHPDLGGEMMIMQGEIQLGLTAGEALKKLGDRCDLQDVRDLASVLLQSEKMGAGIVRALRNHADSSRLERQMRAEELAHKAAVKILFPTMLCIFPVIFIVLLGPAAYQVAELFSK